MKLCFSNWQRTSKWEGGQLGMFSSSPATPYHLREWGTGHEQKKGEIRLLASWNEGGTQREAVVIADVNLVPRMKCFLEVCQLLQFEEWLLLLLLETELCTVLNEFHMTCELSVLKYTRRQCAIYLVKNSKSPFPYSHSVSILQSHKLTLLTLLYSWDLTCSIDWVSKPCSQHHFPETLESHVTQCRWSLTTKGTRWLSWSGHSWELGFV